MTYSQDSGTLFALGTSSVTATVTDGLGRTDSCTFSVTVRDTTAPSLSCPADVTAEATSTTGADVDYPPATASDSVSNVTVTYSAASGSHFDVGATPVSVTATDGSGNTATCSFTVTVYLPAEPQITCPGGVVEEATSVSGALVSYPPASAEGREPLSVSYSQDSGTQFALGTNSVTATVTDGLGRTDSCTFSVAVRDTTAPSVHCGTNLVVEATGAGGAAVSFSQPTATDSVTSAPSVSVSHTSGSIFPLGSTQVTAIATDAAGNSASCTFSVTVRDTTAPSLACPADVIAEATSAEGATVGYSPATASDSISVPTLQYSHAPETRFGLGTTTVTVAATDDSGNTASCSFTVTVRDATPPALVCGSDLIAEATGPTGAVVSFALPMAVDTVTPAPVLTTSHEPGSLFPLGATPITVTARDEAGNVSSCSFTVTVRDTTAPEVGCPGALIAEAQDATGASVAYSVPAPHDTVTLSPTVSTSHASGSRFPLGTTQVHLSALDEAGNTASCTFTVTVQDTTAPKLTCPADISVTNAPPEGTAVDYPAATSSDLVSTPAVSYSQPSGTIFPVGTTPVTVTATDASGNSATCSFQVHVQPTASVPPPTGGCGCGAGSDTSSVLGWGALLLAWGVTRRRPAPRP